MQNIMIILCRIGLFSGGQSFVGCSPFFIPRQRREEKESKRGPRQRRGKEKLKGDHAKGVVQRTAFSPDTYGAFGSLYCSFAVFYGSLYCSFAAISISTSISTFTFISTSILISILIANHPCHLVEGKALLSCYLAPVVVVLPRGKHK